MSDDKNMDYLTKLLYPDIKHLIIKLGKYLSSPIKRELSQVFQSPEELLDALKKNEVKDGDWITLSCIPSMYGPFLRNHILSPFYGSKSTMRKGPRIISADGNPTAFALDLISLLQPVGLYPRIDDNLYQINLYPIQSSVFGFISPLGNMTGTNIPAISNSHNLRHQNLDCTVRGIIRMITPELLSNIGLPIEKWDDLRASGDLWFLDLSDNYSSVSPSTEEAITTEMWGGLYANGRLEIQPGSSMKFDSIKDCIFESLQKISPDADITYGRDKNNNITEAFIFATGIRARLDAKRPIYSFHMDADLALDSSNSRAKFDNVIKTYLGFVEEAAKNESVEIDNLHDLDFSYTDSEKAYSVLRSGLAENMSNPVGVAIRDWHRLRNAD